ncbi:hypothetical protein NSK11_contig00072-0017 [Nocardia seriolae]|uniref:Uncharacterized protein n=1 Tax=Nocardia seriolae TaxID=37332 RepID=A0ABC9YX29_9NOCA|nr:hypothetical protein NSERKGN1266_11680 [Nocardia seriolae]BEK98943.1 hypothetical protein NSER024013_68490 [Nocardia seriolae]GAM48184.1 hypothetical protein NS07_v2contig00067-0017 [Nocardia seriolae]GAP30094.1 hypothetical protein NSK11_contig00072-0017 [Nocardia seriolae]GEM25586.1 hypothetical protein NS2_38250 [Nocardia seriolae NBRC 15557]
MCSTVVADTAGIPFALTSLVHMTPVAPAEKLFAFVDTTALGEKPLWADELHRTVIGRLLA